MGCNEDRFRASADRVRVTSWYMAPDEDTGVLTRDVELCPEARVYSYTLCASHIGEPPPPEDEPEILAILQLQDQELVLRDNCCSIRADLPGLRWPDRALLTAAINAAVTLTITYGNCDG